MGFVSNQEWQDYANIVNEFMQQDAALKEILWKRYTWGTDRWREDHDRENSNTIPLNCLLNYNYFRSWPITATSEAGENDRQSVQILFNKAYLASLGYLAPGGSFNFNPDKDTFFIDGKPYKAMGDTAASQAKSDDLLVSVIVKREDLATGQSYAP